MFYQSGNVLEMEIRAAFIMLRVWMTLNNKKPLAGTSLRVAAFSALARGGRPLVRGGEGGRGYDEEVPGSLLFGAFAAPPGGQRVSQSFARLGSAQARASVAG